MKRKKIGNEKFIGLWKKASEDQKKKIFYYSLFDFKSFEAEGRIELINKIKKIQNDLISLIKKVDKNFFGEGGEEDFINYAQNDGLLKSIFLFELRNKGIQVKSCGNHFPDLMVNNSIHLEMKRQTSTKNMGDDFWGVDLKECDNLILLILFPIFEDDDEERVKDLTNGYYFIKNILANKRKTDILICHPSISNFRTVLESIINCIKSPRWNENVQKK